MTGLPVILYVKKQDGARPSFYNSFTYLTYNTFKTIHNGSEVKVVYYVSEYTF